MTRPSEAHGTHAYAIVPDDPVEAERFNARKAFGHEWEDDTNASVHPEDHDA